MGNQELIEKLELEINSLTDELNSIKPVICNHIVCPSCIEEMNNQNLRREVIEARLAEKRNILNQLK